MLCVPVSYGDWMELKKNPQINENYYRLKKALDYYESLETRSWPVLSAFNFKKGAAYPEIPELRERLRLTGDLPASSDAQSEVYDNALWQSVRSFQWRHGLKPDGVIGLRTQRELNVSPFERAEEIRRNMQRWAALPPTLGKRFIFINIPEYRLDLIEDGKSVLHMKIIVGKPDRPTPELSSVITRAELNPYWNIPPEIAKKDILPKILKDPHYLEEMNIKVVQHRKSQVLEVNSTNIDWQGAYKNGFAYEFRQEPGENNSLGLVKFDFSNSYSIYMHDTPAKELFDRDNRTFSSGCIRLEKPFVLLSYLLQDNPQWNLQRIAETLQSGKLTIIKTKPFPIYIIYATAWIDRQGILHFRSDPYGYNEDPNPNDYPEESLLSSPFSMPLSFYA